MMSANFKYFFCRIEYRCLRINTQVKNLQLLSVHGKQSIQHCLHSPYWGIDKDSALLYFFFKLTYSLTEPFRLVDWVPGRFDPGVTCSDHALARGFWRLASPRLRLGIVASLLSDSIVSQHIFWLVYTSGEISGSVRPLAQFILTPVDWYTVHCGHCHRDFFPIYIIIYVALQMVCTYVYSMNQNHCILYTVCCMEKVDFYRKRRLVWELIIKNY